MKKLTLLAFLIPMLMNAQDNPLMIFKPLENYVWKAEGNWGDGSKFKQEIHLDFSLNDTLVILESIGFTNSGQTAFGPRNHGIRQYDQASKTIKFWEFDVFGGLTTGTVKGEGKNLIYSYEYGGTWITEMWIYISDNTYNFIVGSFEEGAWKQKFLETTFVGTPK